MDIKKIDARMADVTSSEDQARWLEIDPAGPYVHGLLWKKENHNFHRLEDAREWRENLRLLSCHTSGVYLIFRTDSPFIKIKAEVSSAAYMSHMTAVATIGFDLYARIGNEYHPLAVTKINRATYTTELVKGLARVEREYLLYFPLYIDVKSVSLGLAPTASIKAVTLPARPKAIFYGTSILQGGCASRPGMSMTNIFMRKHPEYDVYNLGFSGNGFCDVELARALSQVNNIQLLVLELEMNNGMALEKRLEPFLSTLKASAPNAHLILFSRFPQALSLLSPTLKSETDELRRYQRETLSRIWPSSTFVDGAEALASLSYEGAVDGVHLTDLGFTEWEKSLERILSKGDEC